MYSDMSQFDFLLMFDMVGAQEISKKGLAFCGSQELFVVPNCQVYLSNNGQNFTGGSDAKFQFLGPELSTEHLLVEAFVSNMGQ